MIVTAKAEETRDRILSSALELFRARGFENTTMRDIAAEAGVATGASYYYFRSKEDLVMAFYVRTAEEMHELLPQAFGKTRDLRKRLRVLLELKLEQFRPHRRFLGALLRSAVDPASALSPFGKETRELRQEAVDWFREAIVGSSERIPRELLAHLPVLLWLYQMGLILFWLFDRSPDQHRTQRLLDGSLDLVMQLIRLSRMPFMGPVRKRVIRLLDSVVA